MVHEYYKPAMGAEEADKERVLCQGRCKPLPFAIIGVFVCNQAEKNKVLVVCFIYTQTLA